MRSAGPLPEPAERVRRQGGVDRVVGEEPERDRGSGGADDGDAEAAEDRGDRQAGDPEPGERRGGGHHAVQPRHHPVRRAHPPSLRRHQGRGRGEPAHEEEQRHDLPDPGDPPVLGREVEEVAAHELAVVEHHDHAEPVADGHDDHGQRPVEVDGAVAADRGEPRHLGGAEGDGGRSERRGHAASRPDRRALGPSAVPPSGPLGDPPDVAVEMGPTAGRLARPRATGAILDTCLTNTGLIGFDLETARRFRATGVAQTPKTGQPKQLPTMSSSQSPPNN